MAQNREPPAYQEYAATILAQLNFRIMTLQERGLFYTMRLECWVNLRLPANPNDLAKVLGLPADDVARSLGGVMFFFQVSDGFIICPELENYRAHLAERRLKQSQGGKIGSAKTNKKRKNPAGIDVSDGASTPSSNSQPTHRAQVVSLDQTSIEKQSQNQSTDRENIDTFISAYENEEKRWQNSEY